MNTCTASYCPSTTSPNPASPDRELKQTDPDFLTPTERHSHKVDSHHMRNCKPQTAAEIITNVPKRNYSHNQAAWALRNRHAQCHPRHTDAPLATPPTQSTIRHHRFVASTAPSPRLDSLTLRNPTYALHPSSWAKSLQISPKPLRSFCVQRRLQDLQAADELRGSGDGDFRSQRSPRTQRSKNVKRRLPKHFLCSLHATWVDPIGWAFASKTYIAR